MRMEGPPIFAFLLLTAVCSFLVQSMAVYLRSYKREPYLIQSIAVAVLTVSGVLLTAPRWRGAAVALIYFTFSGVVALLWAFATFIFQRKSRQGIPRRVLAAAAFAPGLEIPAGLPMEAAGTRRGAA
jgi:hypothetical protein